MYIYMVHTTKDTIVNDLFIKSSNITGYWMVCHNRIYYIVVVYNKTTLLHDHASESLGIGGAPPKLHVCSQTV